VGSNHQVRRSFHCRARRSNKFAKAPQLRHGVWLAKTSHLAQNGANCIDAQRREVTPHAQPQPQDGTAACFFQLADANRMLTIGSPMIQRLAHRLRPETRGRVVGQSDWRWPTSCWMLRGTVTASTHLSLSRSLALAHPQHLTISSRQLSMRQFDLGEVSRFGEKQHRKARRRTSSVFVRVFGEPRAEETHALCVLVAAHAFAG
jgi:hypothetical protein